MPAKSLPVVHDGFMKPGEAARDLGCSERWLRDGANHRGFPHHRLEIVFKGSDPEQE
ncbi:hypothetical protein [Streptomyces rimosus]|uniref:hypothetical protein n=1 Tax=Streptomyces rimosus TaxID=1927 RepID=UPI000A4113B5|nr:hypothetical protein [Streptomyces rimosus]